MNLAVHLNFFSNHLKSSLYILCCNSSLNGISSVLKKLN
ncbi:hypothetical protein T11_4885 [Trichinella zimbabwensis]|uniref:Uncharacterized protein n=1 Tax=Trichinella zimbabwensis TaxID=268475 RepID=A0A0V1DNI5_9BILA|nr:hypothetical protein T11_4885 [Trichinella zimbabwensis]